MKQEWTRVFPYEDGKREAVYRHVNHVVKFSTKTSLQRMHRTEVDVHGDSFPGPVCLVHLCNGYWEARRPERAITDGIWIIHASRGDFDVLVDGNQLHFESNATLFGGPWHKYRPAGRHVPACKLIEITIEPESFTSDGKLTLGPWSRISEEDQQILGKLIANPQSHILQHESVMGCLMKELLDEYERADYGLLANACSLIDRILVALAKALLRGPGGEQVIPKRIRDLLCRIEASLDHPWTREEMGSETGFSPASLTQWFNRTVGFSPMRYVVHVRILRARALLENTDQSVTDIAYSLKFSSSQRFATVFRRQVGMTPTEYRARIGYQNPE